LDIKIKGWQAEIHHLKTQYSESYEMQISITSTLSATRFRAILANVNSAFIDISTGEDSEFILQNLKTCQLNSDVLYGHAKMELRIWIDSIYATLYLRDGDYTGANAMFSQCFASSQHIMMEEALFCLEYLGWAGIFLALALKSKDKLSTISLPLSSPDLCCSGR
jgi:hypothetical protein